MLPGTLSGFIIHDQNGQQSTRLEPSNSSIIFFSGHLFQRAARVPVLYLRYKEYYYKSRL